MKFDALINDKDSAQSLDDTAKKHVGKKEKFSKVMLVCNTKMEQHTINCNIHVLVYYSVTKK